MLVLNQLKGLTNWTLNGKSLLFPGMGSAARLLRPIDTKLRVDRYTAKSIGTEEYRYLAGSDQPVITGRIVYREVSPSREESVLTVRASLQKSSVGGSDMVRLGLKFCVLTEGSLLWRIGTDTGRFDKSNSRLFQRQLEATDDLFVRVKRVIFRVPVSGIECYRLITDAPRHHLQVEVWQKERVLAPEEVTELDVNIICQKC